MVKRSLARITHVSADQRASSLQKLHYPLLCVVTHWTLPTSIRNGFAVFDGGTVAGVDFPAQVDDFEDSFFASNSLATRSIASAEPRGPSILAPPRTPQK